MLYPFFAYRHTSFQNVCFLFPATATEFPIKQKEDAAEAAIGRGENEWVHLPEYDDSVSEAARDCEPCDASAHLPENKENVPEDLVGAAGDVVEVSSQLDPNRPKITWDAEAIVYQDAIIKIKYSDLDGGNEQTWEKEADWPE